MGMGDILMSMGEARALHEKTGLPVLIVDGAGRPVKDQGLFAGVPYILPRATTAGPHYEVLRNGPGLRPYIQLKGSRRWTWKPYQPKPAQLVFTKDELEFAERYRGLVMIEPQIKQIGHDNKAWGAKKWVALVAALRERGVTTVQCGPGGTLPLADRFALTPSFRYAAAVLSVSKAAVLPEGGLHHAAAAVGTPAVVVFGEFISPEVTGYPAHRNLFTGSGLGCGMRTGCLHCRKAMSQVSVTTVAGHVDDLLRA